MADESKLHNKDIAKGTHAPKKKKIQLNVFTKKDILISILDLEIV